MLGGASPAALTSPESALFIKNYFARSSLAGQVTHFSKENNSLPSSERLDALGRRAAEGVPDSRAEAKGLGSAQRGKRPVRGRRHLVVN